MSTYVMADGGACHDRNFDQQLRLIDAAAAAGCTAYKTQWVSDPAQMAQRRGRAAADGYEAVYRRYLAWPHEWHERLQTHCAARGIEYVCTVFIKGDVATIAPHVRRFKCASFEAGDAEFLAAHAGYGKPLILSTGMLSGHLVGAIRDYWRNASKATILSLLHCISAYPTPAEQLNLAVLWRRSWSCDYCDEWATGVDFDGFSDHSDPALTLTGSWAVCAGATIVEAHLRLDDTDPTNPDYPHAMTPAQFAEYVRLIRAAEVALGTGEKRQQPCEAAMSAYRVGAAL